MSKPLILHICCAPCGGGCVEHPFLAENDYRITRLFYSNSNLDSIGEFERRLEYVCRLGELYDLPVEVDPYDHEAYLNFVAGFENEPERGKRCALCFRFNLSRSAAFAAAAGEFFATTLTVSPLKSSAVIFAEGGKYENFAALDFKKRNGYLAGVRLAEQHGFYRQNYCGCEFSKIRVEK